MKLVVADVAIVIVNLLDGRNFFMVNTDEKRAMRIIAYEYVFDDKRLEALMREYSVIKSDDLKNYDTATETYYPSPREIADNFIEWLKNTKKIDSVKRIGSLNKV